MRGKPGQFALFRILRAYVESTQTTPSAKRSTRAVPSPLKYASDCTNCPRRHSTGAVSIRHCPARQQWRHRPAPRDARSDCCVLRRPARRSCARCGTSASLLPRSLCSVAPRLGARRPYQRNRRPAASAGRHADDSRHRRDRTCFACEAGFGQQGRPVCRSWRRILERAVRAWGVPARAAATAAEWRRLREFPGAAADAAAVYLSRLFASS